MQHIAPAGLIGTAPLVLAVSGNAVGKTPAELLLWARNLGDKGGYGTPGVGTVGHLGQIQLALLPPGLTKPHVASGKFKAIGVTSPLRWPIACVATPRSSAA